MGRKEYNGAGRIGAFSLNLQLLFTPHISQTATKVIRNILRIAVGTVLVVYLLLLLAVNFGPIKHTVTHAVQEAFAEKLHTKVEIGDLQIGLFNRVVLTDVTINDQRNAPMLSAGRMTAKIELRSLFRHQLALRTVSLLDTDVNLCRTQADSADNFQFFIDALSSKEPKKTSTLDLRINSIILRRVNVRYDKRYLPYTPAKLNPSHLSLRDINANISLKSITNDSVSLRIRSLSLKEQSGLTVNNLQLKLNANRTTAHISGFSLNLTDTRFEQSELTATYDARKSWSDLWPTLRVQASVDGAAFSTNDFAWILQLPKDLKLEGKFSTNLLIVPGKIQFNTFRLSSNDQALQLNGNATLLKNEKGFYAIATQIEALRIKQRFTETIAPCLLKDTTWTRRIVRLGDIELQGHANYRFGKEGTSRLNLHTEAGALRADVSWSPTTLSGGITLSKANPAHIMGNAKMPNDVTAHINANVTLKNKKLTAANAKADVSRLVWNEHTFSPINLTAAYNGTSLSAHLKSSDAAAHLNLNGTATMVGSRINGLKLLAQVTNLHPSTLGLQGALAQADYNGNVSANLTNLQGSKPTGYVTVRDFAMVNGPHGDYSLNELTATLSPAANGSNFELRSDFADATLSGPCSVNTMKQAALTLATQALPGLFSSPKTQNHDTWNLNATVKRTDILKQFAGTDLQIESPIRLNGTIDASGGRTYLTASTDGITINNTTVKEPSIYLQGQGAEFKALAQLTKDISGKPFKVEVNLATRDSALTANVAWRRIGGGRRYEGTLETVTRFFPTKRNGIDFSTQIRPTQFLLADSVWNIASGTLSFRNREFSAHNVSIARQDQSLAINGQLDRLGNDSIVADLHNMDISYILGLVNFDAVEFGGLASGQAVLTHTTQHPQLHTRLSIPDFRFNKGPMGSTNIVASWNNTDKRINLDADMRLPHKKGGTQVKGYVSPAEKGLELNITANHTDLSFLRRYMDGIFDNFRGDATGFVRLYGPFKKLDFQGEVTANAQAKVIATGVSYHVTDGAVHMYPGTFAFENFAVTDVKGGKGTANGALRHTHLKNLRYDFNVEANHMLCYDKPEEHDLPFYSTTIGSGNVSLRGGAGHFDADINLRPETGTTFVYNLGATDNASTDNSMVHFFRTADATAEANGQSDQAATEEKEANETSTDITLNLLIDANPSAQVQIITDPRAGDRLTLYGSGAMRATYRNKGSFEMYGTYRIARGDYKLSIQDIIRKDLTIDPESQMTFSGDPLAADLNLKAKYTVNGVSLSDLNYGAGFNQKSVKVDCILNIGGKARSPQINFDLDLHNISEDEKQMVRQLIATDEDMNRQIIYLLGIGRFYTASTNGTVAQTTSQQQSSAAMRSFISTTITSQLNSAISNVLGNQSHWNFGANVATGTYGWNDMEVEGLLEGRLFNDRLLINGNFGYRDRPTYTSNFVGDFDIRYLLTPRGSVSLRAYSETTDRYFTKNSLTTQGIGVSLQRDFQKFTDLFKPKRKRKLLPKEKSATKPKSK